ncbi:hypothetical protein LIER_18658 [Lithospermum erythrorhizon]|uniref:Uncharacterized protein n=1 Tax=Lithospermum erythrorhizon TaxID=34254 RepID=A0AAV3QEZ6_LITER
MISLLQIDYDVDPILKFVVYCRTDFEEVINLVGKYMRRDGGWWWWLSVDKKRDNTKRRRGTALVVKTAVERRRNSTDSTNIFVLRIGGIYKISGTAEKATANNTSSILMS